MPFTEKYVHEIAAAARILALCLSFFIERSLSSARCGKDREREREEGEKEWILFFPWHQSGFRSGGEKATSVRPHHGSSNYSDQR